VTAVAQRLRQQNVPSLPGLLLGGARRTTCVVIACTAVRGYSSRSGRRPPRRSCGPGRRPPRRCWRAGAAWRRVVPAGGAGMRGGGAVAGHGGDAPAGPRVAGGGGRLGEPGRSAPLVPLGAQQAGRHDSRAGGDAGQGYRCRLGAPVQLAALREQILEPRHRILGELLAAAAARGDVHPDALTPECIATGPALLRQHFIESGQQPTDEDIRLLVDNVLIPMLRPAP
jgi:Tetracyclin repressor-like, C-terminal domain